MRIVLAITGASGAIYGVRLLEELSQRGVEVHLIISRWGAETIKYETNWNMDQLGKLAAKRYEASDMAAAVSSGSFPCQGMVVAPCSMKTLSAIAHGYSDNLIVRAADVALKERRKLIIMPRETPLTAIHLQNMLELSRAGAVIMPPMPAFYNKPQTLENIIEHWVSRALDQLGVDNDLVKRWGG